MLTYIGRVAGDVGKLRLKFRNALRSFLPHLGFL